MNSRETILKELQELQSPLAQEVLGNPYQVPTGYFEGLASQVMARIRAIESGTAREELQALSPFMASLTRELPYQVPAGYFEELSDWKQGVIYEVHESDPALELDSLSPLLKTLKKENPYTVPAGYFDQLNPQQITNPEPVRGKLVSLSAGRKWIRYAAAAVVTGIITMASLVLLINGQPDPNRNPEKWVQKHVEKKVDDDQLDAFVALVSGDERAPVSAIESQRREVMELMEDVPVEDIQQFLNETAISNSDDDADILLN